MHKDKVKSIPLWVWVISGLSAPLAQTAGESSWLSFLVTGILCCALCCTVVYTAQKGACTARWYCFLQVPFLWVAAGQVAVWSEDCWPTGADFPVVPLTLLVLAAFAAWKGAAKASRCGSMLFWFLALLYAVVLAAGIKDLEPGHMLPRWEQPPGKAVFLLLLPAAVIFVPHEKGKGSLLLFGLAGLGAVISAWTAGALSPAVVQSLSQPFYEYSRSLSLLAVAQRFEAFVSVALTMGYFALLSFLLSASGHLTDSVFPGKGSLGVAAGAAAAALSTLSGWQLPQLWLAAAAVLMWALLPMLALRTQLWKKSKKSEKST